MTRPTLEDYNPSDTITLSNMLGYNQTYPRCPTDTPSPLSDDSNLAEVIGSNMAAPYDQNVSFFDNSSPVKTEPQTHYPVEWGSPFQQQPHHQQMPVADSPSYLSWSEGDEAVGTGTGMGAQGSSTFQASVSPVARLASSVKKEDVIKPKSKGGRKPMSDENVSTCIITKQTCSVRDWGGCALVM